MIRRARFAWLLFTPLVMAPACGGPQAPAGAGESCFRAADCDIGLVCVEGVCTTDVSGIGSMVEGPMNQPPPLAGAAGTASGGTAAGGAPSTGGTAVGGMPAAGGMPATGGAGTGAAPATGGSGGTTMGGAAGAGS